MPDPRLYFRVDVGYFTNPKIAAVLAESPTAVCLHLESIGYAAQHLTDGRVPKSLVMRMVDATEADAQLLFDNNLWVGSNGSGHVYVHDYLEHQPSAATRSQAATRARNAARSRWEQPRLDAGDANGNASSTAPSNATRNASSNAEGEERKGEERTTLRMRMRTADAARASEEEFARFWAQYPRKVDKPRAAKAWGAAVKKTSPEVIMAGLIAQLPAMDARSHKRFIPYPATWLNGERWSDDVDVPGDVVDTRPEGWR